jgi:hypothetical protein
MRFTTSLLGLAAWSLLALSSFAEDPNAELFGCAAEPSDEFLDFAKGMQEQEINNAFQKDEDLQIHDIPVHFHVLSTTQQELDSISVSANVFLFQTCIQPPT